MKRKILLAGFLCLFSTGINAYDLRSFDSSLGRAELYCNDGRFVGYVHRDSDGYYSGGPAGNVSRDVSEVVGRMLGEMPGECR